MRDSVESVETALGEILLWDMPLYARLRQQIDPYTQLEFFRRRDVGYTGDHGFWKVPSPEPQFSDALRRLLLEEVQGLAASPQGSRLRNALSSLASTLAEQYRAEEIVFVAILRAGVPIADWLRTVLPGSAAVATSLFVGVGLDQAALRAIQADFPDREIVFVDGWTGKGGVARALQELGAGPLAVLVDPWRLADFRGAQEDCLSPSALFTGPTTLGFSRTSIAEDDGMFEAYRFPESYLEPELVQAWRGLPQVWFPSQVNEVSEFPLNPQPNTELPKEKDPAPSSVGACESFQASTDLRVQSNEVCRAFINSNPGQLKFACTQEQAQRHYGLLLRLAEQLRVACEFQCASLQDLQTNVACTLELH